MNGHHPHLPSVSPKQLSLEQQHWRDMSSNTGWSGFHILNWFSLIRAKFVHNKLPVSTNKRVIAHFVQIIKYFRKVSNAVKRILFEEAYRQTLSLFVQRIKQPKLSMHQPNLLPLLQQLVHQPKLDHKSRIQVCPKSCLEAEQMTSPLLTALTVTQM